MHHFVVSWGRKSVDRIDAHFKYEALSYFIQNEVCQLPAAGWLSTIDRHEITHMVQIVTFNPIKQTSYKMCYKVNAVTRK